MKLLLRRMAVLGGGLCVSLVADAGPVPDLGEMRADVVKLGLCAYVSDPSSPKVAPHIHSVSYVAWIPDTDVQRKTYEMRKRDFGLVLVGELEKCAMRQRKITEYSSLEDECKAMFRVVEWIKTSPGYGNCFLAHWAENLILNMVGKMAVCPEANTNTVNGILSKLGNDADDARFRQLVLNDEAFEKVSVPKSPNNASSYYSLMRQWGKGMNAAMKHFGVKGSLGRTWRDASKDERQFAFYLDDSCSGVLSLRTMWDRKLHSVICAMSPEVVRIKAIKGILRFRELIGELPLPSKLQMADAASREKYIESIDFKWNARYSMKYGPNCTGFWTLMICDGSFLDQWTSAYFQDCLKCQ